MKLIHLGRNLYAQVDDEDFTPLSAYRWTAQWHNQTKSYYARRKENGISILMHRQIMGLVPGDGKTVDHCSPPETLNNQRYNLRIATHSENQCNRGIQSNNKSGVKGVSWHKRAGKWIVYVQVLRKSHYLGLFDSLDEARQVRDEAADRLHGEFARAA